MASRIVRLLRPAWLIFAACIGIARVAAHAVEAPPPFTTAPVSVAGSRTPLSELQQSLAAARYSADPKLAIMLAHNADLLHRVAGSEVGGEIRDYAAHMCMHQFLPVRLAANRILQLLDTAARQPEAADYDPFRRMRELANREASLFPGPITASFAPLAVLFPDATLATSPNRFSRYVPVLTEQCAAWALLRQRQLIASNNRELLLLLWRPDGSRRPCQAGQFANLSGRSYHGDFDPFAPHQAALFAWRVADRFGGDPLLASFAAVTQQQVSPDPILRQHLVAFAGLAEAAQALGDQTLRDTFVTQARQVDGFWRVYLAMLAADAGAGLAMAPTLFSPDLLRHAGTFEELSWAARALVRSGGLEHGVFLPDEREMLILWLYGDATTRHVLCPSGPALAQAMSNAARYAEEVALPDPNPYTGMGATLSQFFRQQTEGLSNDALSTWLREGRLPVVRWQPVPRLSLAENIAVLEKYGFRTIVRHYLREYDAEFMNSTSEADGAATMLDYRERDDAGATPVAELDRLGQIMRAFVTQPESYLACLADERCLTFGKPPTRTVYTVPEADTSITVDGFFSAEEWQSALCLDGLGAADSAAVYSQLYLATSRNGLCLAFVANAGFSPGRTPHRFILLVDPDRSYRRFVTITLPLSPDVNRWPAFARVIRQPSPDWPTTCELEIPWGYFDRSGPPAAGEVWVFNLAYDNAVNSLQMMTPFWKHVPDMAGPGKTRIHLEQSSYLCFGTTPAAHTPLMRSGLLGMLALLAAGVGAFFWRRRNRHALYPTCPPPAAGHPRKDVRP